MDTLQISIIIPVYRDIAFLKKCLEALKKAQDTTRYTSEIIVIDDCSPNCTDIADLAASYKYRYKKLEKRSGPAMARNLGVDISLGQVLFFVDADVVIETNCLNQVGDFLLGNNTHYCAVIGSYMKEIYAKDFPTNFKNLMHHYVHQNSSENAPHFWTGCGAVQKDAFYSVKGFDIDYKDAIIEDVDFGYRLIKKGYSIYLDKKLQVKHLKKYTLVSLFHSDFFHRAIPMSKLILKYKILVNDQNTKLHSLISTVLTLFAFPICACIFLLKGKLIFFLASLSILALFPILNKGLIDFMVKEKGVIFGIKGAIYLGFYYVYCGVGFIISFLDYYNPFKLIKIAK